VAGCWKGIKSGFCLEATAIVIVATMCASTLLVAGFAGVATGILATGFWFGDDHHCQKNHPASAANSSDTETTRTEDLFSEGAGLSTGVAEVSSASEGEACF
jgi:hypothetical protein